jgi:hypothetical protein
VGNEGAVGERPLGDRHGAEHSAHDGYGGLGMGGAGTQGGERGAEHCDTENPDGGVL